MTIPPITANSTVNAKDSCNSICCIPRKKRKKFDHEVVIDTDDKVEKVEVVFQKHQEKTKHAEGEKHKGNK